MESKNLNNSEENINSSEELKNDQETQPKTNQEQLIRRPTRNKVPSGFLGPPEFRDINMIICSVLIINT